MRFEFFFVIYHIQTHQVLKNVNIRKQQAKKQKK